MARVAVTGAGGFVGRTLVRRFASTGAPVLALARRAPADLPEAARHRPFDLEQPDSVFEGEPDLETVVHAAGRAHQVDDAADPEIYSRLNGMATERLARLAAGHGVRRFVFLSTIGVHGPPADPVAGLAESDPRAPATAYARSKAEAEDRLAEVARQTGIEVVVIRPALVSGAGAPGNLARLVRLVRLGMPLPVPCRDNARAFVDVDDLADLVATASGSTAAAGGTFLAADPQSPSTRDVLTLLGAGMGRRVRTVPVPGRLLRGGAAVLGRADDYDKLFGTLRVDASHARRTLDWQPRVGVRDSLRRTGAAAG